MKKFSQFEYKRPDGDRFSETLRGLIERFSVAESADEQNSLMAEINKERNAFETMVVVGQIRHDLDTGNEFYDKENDALDQLSPVYEELKSEFYAALLASPFRSLLEDKWGTQLFQLAELQMKTYSPEVFTDLQEENKLSSSYVKLKASAAIQFQGEERNLSQMQPFVESPDRDIRLAAVTAVSGFYEANCDKFDDIYDKLVHLRHKIALKLEFKNFISLAYARLGRSDYDANMVATYRKQVHESLVPLATKLRERQASRLGLDVLQFHDESFKFLSGNAVPKGDPEWIRENGRVMYNEMSSETGEFFNFMLENELTDLVTRKGKAGGGYCTYIPDEKSPFIFSNFNGTSGDVDVMTHEAGHAFQCYRSRHFQVPEYYWPTYEACEIHSMSMEFFSWPWMKNFFIEDEKKYKFTHLAGAVLFIPYGVAVDEFQHWVYENPEVSPVERRAQWRKIEKKYLPHREYEKNSFLEQGGFWLRQGHIFQDPFYYIDYTLAQVCAMEFWGKSRIDRGKAWGDYLHLCNLGGSLSFSELVKSAGLSNPFTDGTIEKIMEPVSRWLNSIEDKEL